MTTLTELAADLEPFMIDLINKVIGDHAGIGTDDDDLMLGNVIRLRGTTVDIFEIFGPFCPVSQSRGIRRISSVSCESMRFMIASV